MTDENYIKNVEQMIEEMNEAKSTKLMEEQ